MSLLLADIYKPELWSGFFATVGGGAAALTGLIFVALSLNVGEATKEATHKYRSINTLAGLTVVFASCGLVLMPGQNHKAIGIELATVALAGLVIFLYGFQQAFKFGSHPSKYRLAIGSCLYAAEIAGAVMLVSGSIAGLYLAATALILNIAFMISAAWLLVVGIYNAKQDRTA